MGLPETFAALRSVRSRHVVPALLLALDAPHTTLRTLAVQALIAARDESAMRALVYRYQELPAPAREVMCNSVPALRVILDELRQSPDEDVRGTVLEICETNGGDDAAEILAGLLADPNTAFGDRAEAALRQIIEQFELERSDAAERRKATDSTRRQRRRERVHERGRQLFRALKAAMEALPAHGREFVVEACLRVGGECRALVTDALRLERESRKDGPVEQFLVSRHDTRTLEYLLERLADHRADIRAIASRAISQKKGGEVNTNLGFVLDELVDDEQLRRVLVTCGNVPWLAMMTGHVDRYPVRVLRRLAREVHRLSLDDATRAEILGVLAECRDADLAEDTFSRLKQLPVDAAGPVLSRLTRSRRQQLVQASFQALADSGWHGTLQVATRLVDSHFAPVRDMAAAWVARRAWRRYADGFESLPEPERRRMGRMLRHVDDGVIDELKQQIGSADPTLRIRALRLLDLTSNAARATDHVLQLMRDPDPRVRATVVGLLATLRSEAAIGAIAALLEDSDRRVRANAIEAVEALGERALARALVPFLGDSNNRIRANAAKALYVLGVPEASQVLQSMLDHHSELMRMSAIWAIGQTRPEGSLEWLRRRRAIETAPGIQKRLDHMIAELSARTEAA